MSGTCSNGGAWYVCSARGYSGCCSHDPCTDGICRDSGRKEEEPASQKTTKTPDPTTHTIVVQKESPKAASTTNPIPPVTNPAPPAPAPTSETKSETETASETTTEHSTQPTSTTTSSSIPVTTGEISAMTSTTPTTTQTAIPAPVSSRPSKNNSALIGGVAGGIAALLLLALLCWLSYRARKKRHRTYNRRKYRKPRYARQKPDSITEKLTRRFGRSTTGFLHRMRHPAWKAYFRK